MSKASPDWTRRSRPGAVCSLRASPRSWSRPAESAWYSWTVPPGRGRSPNGVPRPRLSVYHTYRHAIVFAGRLADEPAPRERAGDGEVRGVRGSAAREQRHPERNAGLERHPAGELIDVRLADRLLRGRNTAHHDL